MRHLKKFGSDVSWISTICKLVRCKRGGWEWYRYELAFLQKENILVILRVK